MKTEWIVFPQMSMSEVYISLTGSWFWKVEMAWGRRKSTDKAGTKIQVASLSDFQKIFLLLSTERNAFPIIVHYIYAFIDREKNTHLDHMQCTLFFILFFSSVQLQFTYCRPTYWVPIHRLKTLYEMIVILGNSFSLSELSFSQL